MWVVKAWLMKIGVLLLRCLLLPLTRLRSLRTARRCPPPPPGQDLLLLPAASLAALIRSRKVSSERVVEVYIERVKAVNPVLNAVVEDRFEEALSEARAVDQALEALGPLAAQDRPLLGVPFTVKGSIAVKGLSIACGRLSHRGEKADRDADCVRLMRGAGAIPLLVSNVPEVCLCYETYNKVVGRTNNPYDLRRTVAGSSGGEASLLGAAASVIGLGSDVGGSARLPALFCGVFGHKPSANIVSYDGHIPVASDELWGRSFSLSPMCRYAEDLPVLLKTMAGDKATQLNLDNLPDIKSIRFFYMVDDGGSITSESVAPEIVNCMHQFTAHLKNKYNIDAKRVDLKGFKNSFELSLSLLSRIKGLTVSLHGAKNEKEQPSLLKAFFYFFTFRSPHNLPLLIFFLLKKIFKSTSESVTEERNKNCEGMKKEVLDLLGSDGVLLYPTFVGPATFHLELQYSKILNCSYTSLFNLLGIPATHCPMGLNSQGLPIGFQVVAGMNQDRLNFAVAQEVQKAFQGWCPPQPNEYIKKVVTV